MNTGPRVAVSHSEPPPVRAVAPPAVLRWIRLGWTDLRRAGWPSLLHGLLAAGLVVGIARRETESVVLAVLVAGKLAWEQFAGPLPGSEGASGGAVIVDHLLEVMADIVAVRHP